MNKKEFIKALEQKLKILEENELKDIINEYKDTIDEKVKHGKTEIEAVKDFGNIDELTKEILKAYKINPKYNENNDNKKNVKEVIDDCESWIKRSAKKMADFSKSIYNDFKKSNNDLTVELIFEILIKAIILLIIFALLRLPFELIDALGEEILDIAFYPLDRILMAFWEVIIFLLYFICCVLLSIAMFKNYFNKSTDTKRTSKKKEVKEEKVEEISESIKTEVKNNSKESFGSVIGKVLKVIFQLFIVICALVPLWFVIIGLVVVLILGIYYLCIGINMIGIILGTIGLLTLFGYLASIFHSIAFNHKKIHFYPFLISLIFIVIGFFVTLTTIFNFEYADSLPNHNFSENISKYEFQISGTTNIYVDYADDIEYIVDNSLSNDKIKVEVLHYDDLTSIGYYDELNEEHKYIHFYTMGNIQYDNGLKLYNLIVDNLKEGKFYNYNLLGNINVKVYANEITMNLIKKD